MDEGPNSSGTGNAFTAILTRRFYGIPVYVFAVIGVLGLAWYFKRKAAKTPETKTDQLGDVTTQTFPQGGMMPWTADIFVNNTFPNGPTPTPNPEPVNQKTIKVLAGQSIVDTIMMLQAMGKDITWDKFIALNPDVGSNIQWGPPSDPNKEWDADARRQDKFRHDATYKLE